jgi:hypothetical protein
MTVEHLSDDDLIEAWLCNVSMELVAERLGITSRWLQEHWRRLQDEGRLPNEPREVNYDEHDGRPSVMTDKQVDPLLRRLKLVHKQPRFDIHPGLR